MAEIDMKQATGFLLAGAVMGAAVALLYAPQSGMRTTRDIKKATRNAVDRLDDLQEDIRGQVTDWVGDMTEIIKDGVDCGRKLSTEGYEQVLQGFDSAKQCVEDGRSRLEQLFKTA